MISTTACVFKHVVFYSLINSTELNEQHPLQKKNRLLSCECQRETVFTVRRWASELILWFDFFYCRSAWLFADSLLGLSSLIMWLRAWAVGAGWCFCVVWMWPDGELSRVSLTVRTLHCLCPQAVFGQFRFLSCSGCWSLWCPGKAWLYSCLWFAATLYSLYRAWGRHNTVCDVLWDCV